MNMRASWRTRTPMPDVGPSPRFRIGRDIAANGKVATLQDAVKAAPQGEGRAIEAAIPRRLLTGS